MSASPPGGIKFGILIALFIPLDSTVNCRYVIYCECLPFFSSPSIAIRIETDCESGEIEVQAGAKNSSFFNPDELA